MNSRNKNKNRKDAGTYFGLPHAVMDSPNYMQLSAKSVKLLNDIGRQFHGFNNGDLCATYSLMQKRGWVSKNTLEEALNELLHYGLILLSRQGGRHRASLYALTWHPINECKNKLDINKTKISPGIWKQNCDVFVPKRLLKKHKHCP